MVGWKAGYDVRFMKGTTMAKKTATMGKGGGDGKAAKGMRQSAAPKPGKATRTPKKQMTGGANPMTPAVARAKARKG